MPGIRVLVVDDSFLFREVLCRELESYMPPGTLFATAGDPFEARDKILSFSPDIMLLDVEMPKMDGVEFLRRLLSQYAQPTLMMSSSMHYREMAMQAGALGFVCKPQGHILRAGNHFFEELAAQICDLVQNPRPRQREFSPAHESLQKTLIAIGASTGGTEALAQVFQGLYPPMPPIVVVQHIPPMFSRLFAERLDAENRLQVKEAADGDRLQKNHVYIAPGNRQMAVRSRGGCLYVSCISQEKVNGHCPSADVLFHSVAESVGAAAVGVILTGMGSDGAKGLLAMRQAGAETLGQDEDSCVVYGMPWAAWKIGGVERQVPLSAIAGALSSLVKNRQR